MRAWQPQSPLNVRIYALGGEACSVEMPQARRQCSCRLLEFISASAISIAAMMRLRLTRLRAFLLLLVFGASLTGQIMAGAAMAAPMDMRVGTHVSAASSCPACNDGSSDGMPSQCVAVACWNLTAIPASDPLIPPVGPTGFIPATYMMIPGLSPGPDPHPPRVLFSV